MGTKTILIKRGPSAEHGSLDHTSVLPALRAALDAIDVPSKEGTVVFAAGSARLVRADVATVVASLNGAKTGNGARLNVIDLGDVVGRPAVFLDIVHAQTADPIPTAKREARGSGPGLWSGTAPGVTRGRDRSAGRTAWPRLPHGGIKHYPDVRMGPPNPRPSGHVEPSIADACGMLTQRRRATAPRDTDAPYRLIK